MMHEQQVECRSPGRKRYFLISVMKNTFGVNNFDITFNDRSVKKLTQNRILRHDQLQVK